MPGQPPQHSVQLVLTHLPPCPSACWLTRRRLPGLPMLAALKRIASPRPKGHQWVRTSRAPERGACRAFWEHLWAAVAGVVFAPSLASRVGQSLWTGRETKPTGCLVAWGGPAGSGSGSGTGLLGSRSSCVQAGKTVLGASMEEESHLPTQSTGGPDSMATYTTSRPHGPGHLGVEGSWPPHAHRWGASGAGSQVPLQG